MRRLERHPNFVEALKNILLIVVEADSRVIQGVYGLKGCRTKSSSLLTTAILSSLESPSWLACSPIRRDEKQRWLSPSSFVQGVGVGCLWRLTVDLGVGQGASPIVRE